MMISVERFLSGTRARSLCMALAESLIGDVADILWKITASRERNYARLDGLSLPDALIDALSDRLSMVATTAIASRTNALDLFPALGRAVDSAMPWEPPPVREAVTALPQIRSALRSTAEGILASSAALWWGEDVDLADQWATQFVRDGRLEPLASPGTARTRLADWRRFVLDDEARSGEGASRDLPVETVPHGAWWSMPLAHGVRQGMWARPLSSTRSVETLGAVGLVLQEDSWGDAEAVLRRVVPGSGSCVYEVHSPRDWASLVEQYPLDVSWSRRGVWGESTGVDGPWFIPDYDAVAGDFDAIHVSTIGYLTTAGDPHPVPGGATVLAGWGPDETYWLTDSAVAADDATAWHRDGHDHRDWTPKRNRG